MSLRIATFNIENLVGRFDFSGFGTEPQRDRSLRLFAIESEADYRALEEARALLHADDTRQLTALAIADAGADIVCMQEVGSREVLDAFEEGYLYKMVGRGYRHKYMAPGNDARGMDVAVMTRAETRDGEPIEFVGIQSHSTHSFADLALHNDELAALGVHPNERVFRRDCLELDLTVGGRLLTLFVTHLKSMESKSPDVDGRIATMPVRMAEARAIRHVVEGKFGGRAAEAHWLVLGDLNDYRERLAISGDKRSGYRFEPVREPSSALDVLLDDGFAVNLVERRPVEDRWTTYFTEGPDIRHLAQLDYILASPALARDNPGAVPDIIRAGQPYRTIFPPGQGVERYPRTGWDRPKASDHCPVAVTLDLP